MPNRAARSLVTRRTGTIALVVSDSESHDDDPFMSRFFADPFFGRVVGGVMSVLRPLGVQLALQLVGNDDARARLVGDLRQGQADGAVVLSLHPDDTLPRLLAEAGLAAVLFGRPADAAADQLRRRRQRRRRRAGRRPPRRPRLPARSA